eukprot:TRINITY_DN11584_c0_g1_i5.p2 TRINITY_DN11584_c0_g1~~TRINITY_DN11584_c0_g1_i5.p2  ORF type:complete len:153 (+),score=34.83 TRINITY_DN11584_c0_g1_i5:611-1069(+)
MLLLDRGADVNIKGKEGHTPLWAACSIGDIAMVKVLLEKGAEINVHEQGPNNALPIYVAAFNNHIDVLEFLLANGAEVDARTTIHTTTLHGAAQVGNCQAVKVLLEHGADPNARNQRCTSRPKRMPLAFLTCCSRVTWTSTLSQRTAYLHYI